MRNGKSSIEEYFYSLQPELDSKILASRSAAQKLELERISLGALELAVLKTLIRMHQPKKFIEIGTLTGTSGLAILEAMNPGTQLWTLEKEDRHADMAEPLLQAAAQEKQQICHIIRGDARETLESIKSEGPFDGIFIDGNKSAYGDYLKWAEANIRTGGVIIADNIFLGGGVYGEGRGNFSDKQIGIMKEFNQRLMDANLYQSCILPTSEGLALAVKLF